MSTLPAAPEKPKNQKTEWLILLGVILVFCLFTIGLAGFLGLTIWQATTVQHLAATHATQTAQAESAQATATHVAQATARANYEYTDSFSDNQNHWGTATTDDEYSRQTIEIKNGVYLWTIEEVKQGFEEWEASDVTRGTYTDFDLYVDAKRLNGTPDGTCFGLEFRASTIQQVDSFYLYEICDNGYFRLEYYGGESQGWTDLIDWTKSVAIRANDWNTLGVSARGAHLILTVNDWKVAELDDTHQASGEVRLAVDIQPQGPVTVEFDNFALQPR